MKCYFIDKIVTLRELPNVVSNLIARVLNLVIKITRFKKSEQTYFNERLRRASMTRLDRREAI